MNVWENYPFRGAAAVLFDFGTTTKAALREINSITDTDLVRERLGVKILHRDLHDILLARSQQGPSVEKIAQNWKSEARKIENVRPQTLRMSASIFLGLRSVIEKENAKAMAINCLKLPRFGLCHPCLAMFELFRTAIIPACEADLNAMLSMMLLTHLAEKPSFMGNVFEGDSATIEIDHCVAPTGMLDDLTGYELADHHGNPSSATAAVDLPKSSPATIARISPDLSQVHFAIGEVVSSHHQGHCRNTVVIHLNNVQNFIRNKLRRHYSVVCADLRHELQVWARAEKIQLVEDTQ